jgi:Transglutaminase-like superfamily
MDREAFPLGRLQANNVADRKHRMQILTRFAARSRADQALLLQSAFMVLAVRLALWVFPMVWVQRFASRAAGKSHTGCPVEKILWAVAAVSRHIPAATCLTQALAAQALLVRAGHVSRVMIGVAKDERLGFQAHAWLVLKDKVVLGGPEVSSYVSLTGWQAEH